MEDSIIEVFRYFSFFGYPPTRDEIYCFLKKQASFGRFKRILEEMVKKSIIKSWTVEDGESKIDFRNPLSSIFQTPRYTIPQYGKKIKSYNLKFKISQKKLENGRFKLYAKLLSLFPQIKLVGLSGSMAMMNASEEDDIDLFIITARNKLFTGRLIAIVIGYLLFVKRKRIYPNNNSRLTINNSVRNKICLNLFFDESNLSVPKFKRSEYVGHEVLQMKPIINKSYTYEKFLYANRWVKDLFPNTSGLISNIKYQISKRHIKNKKIFSFLIFNIVQDWIEYLLKRLQRYFINKHRTSEIISNTQLWFHPDDFAKKIQLSA